MEPAHIVNYMTRFVVFAAIWGIGGSMNLKTRTEFSNTIAQFTDVQTPSVGATTALIDWEIRIDD
jgi:hypothetical protein